MSLSLSLPGNYGRKVVIKSNIPVKESKTIKGVLVNPIKKEKYGAEMLVEDGRIISVTRRDDITAPFILPGFIDAHVHIESSMLTPARFAEMAVRHGTVGVVTDPHEVANVAGIPGIDFMRENGKKVPLEFFFGVPSCVPASPLEKSGAVISAADVETMISNPEFYYLSEMMNFPGVIFDDDEVSRKLASARNACKPIDGHAPGVGGGDLTKYASAGITTDHECSTLVEAMEKISAGIKILIREGSAAKNFDTLIPLLRQHADMLMFCTDDCHPDYLLKGHINKLVSRAVKAGYDLYDTLTAACINPIIHYKLPLGSLREGDRADFVLVNNLEDFDVLETWINGQQVFHSEKAGFAIPDSVPPPYPFRKTFNPGMLKTIALTSKMNVIRAIDGELLTEHEVVNCNPGEVIVSNAGDDLLKLVLLDRYSEDAPVVAFVKGFGLKNGALACSVAHDSHHIIAVGADDSSIDQSLQWIVKNRGGLCAVKNHEVLGIPLPFFGLMTQKPGAEAAREYEQLNDLAVNLGSHLAAPFMTLSFMALTVIPRLKINHKGLFDGIAFSNIPLFGQ